MSADGQLMDEWGRDRLNAEDAAWLRGYGEAYKTMEASQARLSLRCSHLVAQLRAAESKIHTLNVAAANRAFHGGRI